MAQGSKETPVYMGKCIADLRKRESEAVKAYNVNRTPTIYLLDKEGKIMAKDIRGVELEKKIEGLLN